MTGTVNAIFRPVAFNRCRSTLATGGSVPPAVRLASVAAKACGAPADDIIASTPAAARRAGNASRLQPDSTRGSGSRCELRGNGTPLGWQDDRQDELALLARSDQAHAERLLQFGTRQGLAEYLFS